MYLRTSRAWLAPQRERKDELQLFLTGKIYLKQV
jgi:hypothetical protein